jgi:D-glycero-alpha-D-manno-heptose-7-phosphate kinase
VIEAEAPTRIDFAGGTLDLWPLYLFHYGCATVNLAIDIMTRARLTPRKDKKIILTSKDTGKTAEYANLGELLKDHSRDLALLTTHARYWAPESGFELETSSESPVGAGIAASSSLNIALCGAFSKFVGKKLLPPEMALLAGNLEARVLKTPTGCQDYFPALHGGLSVIELTDLGPKRRPVRQSIKSFSDRLTIVYTGRPHHSGFNNWQVYKQHVDGDHNTIQAFETLRQIAEEMVLACDNGEWGVLADLFAREYQTRVRLSKVFLSPEIERLQAIIKGTAGLKICGAGGGGCVFLWHTPEVKGRVQALCEENGFQILPAAPTAHGLKVN